MSYTPGIVGTISGLLVALLGASTVVLARRSHPLDRKDRGLRNFEVLAGVGLVIFGLSLGAPGIPNRVRLAGLVVMIAISVGAFFVRRAALAHQASVTGPA